ncbi:MAG TPA: ATP-binding cassette domain-containing protein [Acholeplasmataceae bacterium]|nr:ATP-binding cassette domain-containing protein [Acholeplasmataceae bacterium]
MIELKNVRKEFKKPVRKPGIVGMFKTLFSMKYTVTEAVKDISFSIQEGEIVGYIGANGAGKSTTIKMMCGILTPTSGEILVDGYLPYHPKQRNQVLGKIGVVFGQRTQLWWDLPLIESLTIIKRIYDIKDEDYNERLSFVSKVLEIENFLNQPIRTLSLGQRMRADLAASLLHNPKILFLDEPTIGLDVLVKDRMIKAIKEIHRRYNTTIILTTHNMDDIIDLCDRVIILDEGVILYDGPVSTVKRKFGDVRHITFSSSVDFDPSVLSNNFGDLVEITKPNDNFKVSFDISKISINQVLSVILKSAQITDINISENSLESIVKQIYETKKY